jgi:hypothetical protein
MQNGTCTDIDKADRSPQLAKCRKDRAKTGKGSKASAKSQEWWFDQYVDYCEQDSRASVNSLAEWCRSNGRLSQDEQAPSQRTLERWAAKNQWQQRKADAMKARAQAIRDELSKRYVKQQSRRSKIGLASQMI